MRLLARATLLTGLAVVSGFCVWFVSKAPLHVAMSAFASEIRWTGTSLFIGCAIYFLALAVNHRLLGIRDGREHHSAKAVRAIIFVISGWLLLILGSVLLRHNLWGLFTWLAGVHAIAFGLLQHIRLFRFQGG